MNDGAWFAAHVRDRFQFLVDDFGYREAPDEDVRIQDLLPAIETVTYLGPVGVRASWEPWENLVEVGAYLLVEGAFPMIAPITTFNIAWIVRARAPEKFRKYVDMNHQRPTPIDDYLDEAASDLRSHASDLLRGDMQLVEEVRSELRRALPGRGVPGVDWWADSDRDVLT